MMPYIKQEKRPFYDDLIKAIVTKFDDPATIVSPELPEVPIWIQNFRVHWLCETEDQQDGQFNYFLNKLIKEIHWLTDGTSYYCYKKMEPAIFFIISELLKSYSVFSGGPSSYFKYNRAMGMLICCSKEIKRRCGSSKAVLATIFIEKCMNNLYIEIGDYEKKKIEENGDV
jgi:hypothetical protein